MIRKQIFVCGIAAMVALAFIACEQPNDTTTVTATPLTADITYTVERADGADGTDDTTGIVFTFSASVDSLNLTAANIAVGGNVAKGALSGTGATRTLAITVNEPGQTTVSITKTGITAETKHVTVYKAGVAAPTLTGITAAYIPIAATVYPTTPPDHLKAGLTVTAQYSNGSEIKLLADEYTLSVNGGALTVPSSVITVTYLGMTDTFTVTVSAPHIDPNCDCNGIAENCACGENCDCEPCDLVTPIADDYTVTGTGSFTYDGSAKAVSVTAKNGKSPGNITILYNGNTAQPVNAGTYTVTFNIAAAAGFNAVNGLAAGSITITRAVGAAVAAPTAASLSVDNVTLNAATAPGTGQTVEYARSGNTTAPVDGWQTGTAFSGLSAGTEYYFFARSASNANYETGAASGGTKIATTLQAGTGITIVSYWADDDGGISIGTGGGPIADNAVSVPYGGSVTFAAQESGYTNQHWTLNGAVVDAGDVVAGEYTFATAGKEPGKNYIVGLRVQKSSKYYFTQITVKVEE
jgi:hypothetical protein